MVDASRHAHRLANDFLDDFETMQRASRARDRRAMSHLDTRVEEEMPPRVIHSSVNRRVPRRSVRMGSVPPAAAPFVTYRPSTFYTSDFELPPSLPRPYYRSKPYVTETPYYFNRYSSRIAEPSRPILSNYYSVSPAPTTQTYTYYYPSAVTKSSYGGPMRTQSFSSLSSDVQAERRRIERRMDNLLDYKVPSPDYYREMRGSLRGLHERLDQHRRMLDRYSGIDMNAAPSTVEDRIESKYQQLASRMGRSSTGMARA